MIQMKSIILAAGRGSRMSCMTDDLPKCMVPVDGKPLIHYIVNTLSSVGLSLDDIGIVTGYKKEKININGVAYFENTEWNNTNMFYSLLTAAGWLESAPCIISYSDIIYDESVVNALLCDDSDICITSNKNFWNLWSLRFDNPFDDLETFKMKEGKLVEIGYRSNTREKIEGQFMGLIKTTPKGWNQIYNTAMKLDKSIIKTIDMTTLFQYILKEEISISVVETEGFWIECDSQSDILLYEEKNILDDFNVK